MAGLKPLVHRQAHLNVVREAELVAHPAQQPPVHALRHHLHGLGREQRVHAAAPGEALLLRLRAPLSVARPPVARGAPGDEHQTALLAVGHVHPQLAAARSRRRRRRRQRRGARRGRLQQAHGAAHLELEQLPHLAHGLVRQRTALRLLRGPAEARPGRGPAGRRAANDVQLELADVAELRLRSAPHLAHRQHVDLPEGGLRDPRVVWVHALEQRLCGSVLEGLFPGVGVALHAQLALHEALHVHPRLPEQPVQVLQPGPAGVGAGGEVHERLGHVGPRPELHGGGPQLLVELQLLPLPLTHAATLQGPQAGLCGPCRQAAAQLAGAAARHGEAHGALDGAVGRTGAHQQAHAQAVRQPQGDHPVRQLRPLHGRDWLERRQQRSRDLHQPLGHLRLRQLLDATQRPPHLLGRRRLERHALPRRLLQHEGRAGHHHGAVLPAACAQVPEQRRRGGVQLGDGDRLARTAQRAPELLGSAHQVPARRGADQRVHHLPRRGVHLVARVRAHERPRLRARAAVHPVERHAQGQRQLLLRDAVARDRGDLLQHLLASRLPGHRLRHQGDRDVLHPVARGVVDVEAAGHGTGAPLGLQPQPHRLHDQARAEPHAQVVEGARQPHGRLGGPADLHPLQEVIRGHRHLQLGGPPAPG
mmetsp:Transcript_47036/g.134621  ORF Transcript_47036/g.134621 Transcript_47036/m.134621 type:complete len:648 (+) Transcript_47036:291-2234(+)